MFSDWTSQKVVYLEKENQISIITLFTEENKWNGLYIVEYVIWFLNNPMQEFFAWFDRKWKTITFFSSILNIKIKKYFWRRFVKERIKYEMVLQMMFIKQLRLYFG